jgi:hypothetical protein
MLVRFIKGGPVRFGPATIHGLPGHIADMEGDDLKEAVASGMVEPLPDFDSQKRSVKPRKKG